MRSSCIISKELYESLTNKTRNELDKKADELVVKKQTEAYQMSRHMYDHITFPNTQGIHRLSGDEIDELDDAIDKILTIRHIKKSNDEMREELLEIRGIKEALELLKKV